MKTRDNIKENKSFRRIAREIGISRTTVTKYIKEYEKEFSKLNQAGKA